MVVRLEREGDLVLSVEHHTFEPLDDVDAATAGRPSRLDALAAELARRGGALTIHRTPTGARFAATAPGSR